MTTWPAGWTTGSCARCRVSDLRTIRAAADLSQSEAAALLGVSVRTLQDWEAGQASTARGLAVRLLAILTRQERLPVWRRPVMPAASQGTP